VSAADAAAASKAVLAAAAVTAADPESEEGRPENADSVGPSAPPIMRFCDPQMGPGPGADSARLGTGTARPGFESIGDDADATIGDIVISCSPASRSTQPAAAEVPLASQELQVPIGCGTAAAPKKPIPRLPLKRPEPPLDPPSQPGAQGGMAFASSDAAAEGHGPGAPAADERLGVAQHMVNTASYSEVGVLRPS
jgi:hypothetical protein